MKSHRYFRLSQLCKKKNNHNLFGFIIKLIKLLLRSLWIRFFPRDTWTSRSKRKRLFSFSLFFFLRTAKNLHACKNIEKLYLRVNPSCYHFTCPAAAWRKNISEQNERRTLKAKASSFQTSRSSLLCDFFLQNY